MVVSALLKGWFLGRNQVKFHNEISFDLSFGIDYFEFVDHI